MRVYFMYFAVCYKKRYLKLPLDSLKGEYDPK